jgi:short-subunit dehydrogenase
MVCDLADTDRLLERLEQDTGDLDIGLLIANAAVSEFAQAHRADAAQSVKVLRTNVEAMMLLCHHFATRFVARGRGGILPVASNGAYCMLPNQANYAASKAYVGHYGEILHYELRARGVDVTTLFPPLVDTDMISELQSKREWMFDQMPFGFGIKADPALVARAGLQGLARRRLRVHPPFAASVFMWVVRRLPDRARCGLFNYMFAKAVDPDNRWW